MYEPSALQLTGLVAGGLVVALVVCVAVQFRTLFCCLAAPFVWLARAAASTVQDAPRETHEPVTAEDLRPKENNKRPRADSRPAPASYWVV